MNIIEKMNEALKYREDGDFRKAQKICFDILLKNPNNTSVLSFLGLMFFETQKYEKAVKYLQKVYNSKPNNAVIKALALSYYHLGKAVLAEKFLKLCAEFDKSPEIYNKLVTVLIVCSYKYHSAYKYSSELYKRHPFDVENMVNLSDICLNIGKFNDSITLCRKAVSINPLYPKAWLQKGILEEVLNCDDEAARKYYKKALRLGDKKGAYHNLCVNYSHSDYKKSNYYGKALIKLGQTNVYNEIMYTIGTNYLAMRQMKKGYKYYIHRCDNAPEEVCPYTKVLENMKKNGTFKNGTLFMLFDWGYGDQFMFARYLSFAAQRFEKVYAMCDKYVINLFIHSFNYIKNVEFILVKKDYPNCDKSILATCLPVALDMDFDNIPYSDGYLTADKGKIKEYGKKYFNTSELKVGLCWEAGSCALRTLHNRSIMFSDLEKLFELNDKIKFYSFQLKSVSASKEKIKSTGVVDLSEIIKDFDDTAALLKNIDVLITVDTSVAHLAGALGVKTFLFLPYFSEWRWFDNTDTTEWYDSVKIFKQEQKKSCKNEIERIYNNLLELLKK